MKIYKKPSVEFIIFSIEDVTASSGFDVANHNSVKISGSKDSNSLQLK